MILINPRTNLNLTYNQASGTGDLDWEFIRVLESGMKYSINTYDASTGSLGALVKFRPLLDYRLAQNSVQYVNYLFDRSRGECNICSHCFYIFVAVFIEQLNLL